MSDLCSEEKHGTNFDQTISNRQLINKTGHELHDKAINDKTKVTLLYTQMHKIASEHPDDTILFDFYDDQNYILNSLKYTFAVHPDLIPKNVTLNLKQYDGKCLSNIKSIQGEGRIDFNYADNIKLLLQHALGIEHQINLKDYFDQYDVDMLMYKGHDKYPDFLKARQLKKDLEPADTSTPTPLEVITPTPSL